MSKEMVNKLTNISFSSIWSRDDERVDFLKFRKSFYQKKEEKSVDYKRN